MTSSDNLADLIDELMDSGKWYGINIFSGHKHTDGARVHLLRDVSTAVCDQVTAPGVPASERLRIQLVAALRRKDQPSGDCATKLSDLLDDI